MKQGIILVLSLILLIFSGIWEINYLSKTSKYALSNIEYSKNALLNDNFDMAGNQIEDLEEDWKNMKVVWNMFVDHSEIDSIEETLVEYNEYIMQKNKEEALVRAELLLRNFNHIVDKQKVRAENVF